MRSDTRVRTSARTGGPAVAELRWYESACELPSSQGDEHALSGVFTSAEWLAALERTTVETVAARRYLSVVTAGSVPVNLPLYLTEASPLWRAYEHEARVPPVWRDRVVFAPSLYSFYGPITAANASAVAGALTMVESQARRWGAQAVVLANLTEPAVRALSVQRPPSAAVRLDTSYRIELGDSAESYFGTLKRRDRADLRRRWRRAGERGVLATELCGSRGRPRLAEFLALADASARKNGTEPIYDLPTLNEMLELPGARLLLAERHGEALAGYLAFAYGQCLTLWSGGIRYDALHEFSPYVFLLYETISLAYHRGWEVLDFGRGNGTFKSNHGASPVPLWSLFYLAHAGDPAIAGLRRLRERLSAGGPHA